jgi:hypothetical protein
LLTPPSLSSSSIPNETPTTTITTLRCVSGQELQFESTPLADEDSSPSSAPYFEFMSLDDLEFECPDPDDGDDANMSSTALLDPSPTASTYRLNGFSAKFNADPEFRNSLRLAIRQDIFDTTPFYQKLSPKAASILLLPDSSLEGSWRIQDDYMTVAASVEKVNEVNDGDSGGGNNSTKMMNIRMKHTTRILQDAFAATSKIVPTGDDLFRAIGRLCGNSSGNSNEARPSTHFIDIYGRQDRKINHSWHLDSGRAGFPTNQQLCRTVLWGFPALGEIDFHGCGVFSHIVKLKYTCFLEEFHQRQRDVEDASLQTAPQSATIMEPVLFDGIIDEKHIVRPP